MFACCLPCPTMCPWLVLNLYSPAPFLPGPPPVPVPDTRLWAPWLGRNVPPLWVVCPHLQPRLHPSFILYWTPLPAAEFVCPSCARQALRHHVCCGPTGPSDPRTPGQCILVTGPSLEQPEPRGVPGDGEERNLPGHRRWGGRMVSVTKMGLPLFQV